MELRHLRYFVSLAEVLHFTRAAEELRVTQSTLSHQIRQLEEELGAILFNRTGRAVQLSPAGEVFRNYAKGILREADAARVAVSELDALVRGSLRIGVIHTLMQPLVMPALRDFVIQHPGIQISIEETTTPKIEAGLTEGSFDFGVAIAPPRSTELVTEPLFDDTYVLIVGTSHHLAKTAGVRLLEIADQGLAMLPLSYVTRRLVDYHFEAQKITVRIRIECNNVDSVLDLVASTTLATVLPKSALQGRKDLVAVSIRAPSFSRTCALFWPRTVQRSRAALTLSNALSQSGLVKASRARK